MCLSRFEELDILRLLPKCKHAFHLDCVDIWLVSHSTCPLCRHCITSNDLTLVDDLVAARNSQEAVGQELATVAALPWSSSNPRRSSVDRRDRPAQACSMLKFVSNLVSVEFELSSGNTEHIRYVGLMQSLFLNRYLYVSGIWQGLLLKLDTK